MIRIFATVATLLAGAAAWGQAPVPVPPPGSMVPSTVDADKGRPSDGTSRRERSSAPRPGAAPPPMNIRIQDSGVRLPKCAAESREGEACKQ